MWTRDELKKIDAAEELVLTTHRRDGKLRRPIIIWVVRVDDDLYVRSYKGSGGAWFRAAQVRPEGHIRAGGVAKDVALVAEANPEINDKIDAAYQIKYSRYPRYVAPMIVPEVRATTLKLVPRG